MIKNIKIYYKVVRSDMSSVIMNHHNGLIYELNIRTFPKNGNGPCAVFNSFKTALYFTDARFSPTRIFKCEIKKSKHKMLWYINVFNQKIICNYPPDGTVYADWVKLIEEVK
jgi:hypothetical protein